MTRIAIVTDSTADLPSELAASRSIAVVPLTVTLDGSSYLDGVEISAADFYARLEASARTATTSQPSPGRFAETYEGLLADHDEVISLHISEKLSGTYAAALQGAGLVDAQRVRVVDSRVVSMPLGLLVLAASTLAAQAGDSAEVLARLAPIQEAVRIHFMVATLEHLRRGGRIGRASALLGSVLQVKPILTIQDGLVTPRERIRTQEKALARLVELARGSGEPVCAFVGHAAAQESAYRIAAQLEPIAESLVVAPLGPVVGAHAGPGTVGVGWYPAALLPLGLTPLAASSR